MRKFLIVLSYTGLAMTAMPAFLVFYGTISFEQYNFYMIMGALLWFGTAPFWIGRIKK